MACANEEAYLNELVVYQLEFEGYMCDRLNNKLVKVHVTISQKNSLMKATFITMSFQNELVVTTTNEPKLIRGGVELTTIFYTFYLPT